MTRLTGFGMKARNESRAGRGCRYCFAPFPPFPGRQTLFRQKSRPDLKRREKSSQLTQPARFGLPRLYVEFLPELFGGLVVDCFQRLDCTQDFGVAFGSEVNANPRER